MTYLDQLLNRAEQLAGELLEASKGRLSIVAVTRNGDPLYWHEAHHGTGDEDHGWRAHDRYAVHRHTAEGIEWELHRGDGTPVTTIEEQRERDEQDR